MTAKSTILDAASEIDLAPGAYLEIAQDVIHALQDKITDLENDLAAERREHATTRNDYMHLRDVHESKMHELQQLSRAYNLARFEATKQAHSTNEHLGRQ